MIVPTWAKALVIVTACGYFLVAAYGAGVKRTTAHFQLAIEAEHRARAEELLRVEAVSRAQEKAASDLLYAQTAQYLEDQNRAKLETDGLRADLRAARVRLSVPVTASSRETAGDSSPAGGAVAEARAELVPAVADDLVAIAIDGDAAVRQLNACIDAYDGVRARMNERVPAQ